MRLCLSSILFVLGILYIFVLALWNLSLAFGSGSLRLRHIDNQVAFERMLPFMFLSSAGMYDQRGCYNAAS